MYEENKRNSRQNCMAPGLRSDELVVTGEGPVPWVLAEVLIDWCCHSYWLLRRLSCALLQGPSWHGRSGVHTNMTNTRITDPELLERR